LDGKASCGSAGNNGTGNADRGDTRPFIAISASFARDQAVDPSRTIHARTQPGPLPYTQTARRQRRRMSPVAAMHYTSSARPIKPRPRRRPAHAPRSQPQDARRRRIGCCQSERSIVRQGYLVLPALVFLVSIRPTASSAASSQGGLPQRHQAPSSLLIVSGSFPFP
jgi:hypothetical protein